MNFNFYTKATRTFRLRLKPFSIVVDPRRASPRRRQVFHIESKKKFLCKKYMPLNNIVVPKQILEIIQIRKSYVYL